MGEKIIDEIFMKEFFIRLQIEKMSELWNNLEDEIWNNF